MDAMISRFRSEYAMNNAEEVDGLLAALICSPEIATPSEYLPEICGGEIADDEAFVDREQLLDFLGLCDIGTALSAYFMRVHPAHAVVLATNHKTVEMKVAPIKCDLEHVVQRGDAAVAGHVQTPPNRRVDLEEQDVELVNFDRSVWLDHSRSRSLVGARSQPPVFPGLRLQSSLSFSGGVQRYLQMSRPYLSVSRKGRILLR